MIIHGLAIILNPKRNVGQTILVKWKNLHCQPMLLRFCLRCKSAQMRHAIDLHAIGTWFHNEENCSVC